MIDKNTSIEELNEIMIENSLTLRAIPRVRYEYYEVRHAKNYPDGEIKYLDAYKREMLIIKIIPKNAGKFIIMKTPNTNATVIFYSPIFYNNIIDAINSMLKD